jgi:oligoendopeptidase F
LSVLQPYDFEVALISVDKSEWFATTDEMIDKLSILLHVMDPEFEEFIRSMQQQNHLDLDTRPNKAP